MNKDYQRIKVAIIFGQPSPYRVDLIGFLEREYPKYEFRFFYGKRTQCRTWDIDFNQLTKPCEVKLKVLIIKKKYNNRLIIYSSNLKKHLDDFNPNVVIASEYNAMAQAALKWARRMKCPFISWTDGTVFSERNINWLQRRLRKKIIGHSDAFIASSTKSKELQIFYGAPINKIYLSRLTVDINKYKVAHKSTKKFTLLYVGRLIELKGVDLLFHALSRIKDLEFELKIAGDGSEKRNLFNLALNLDILDKIIFLGFVSTDRMNELYSNCDLFVLPTREDCFGLVILEAMCASLPILVSKFADGAYDLVDEGKNGFIIDPYDSEAFSTKIKEFFDNKQLRMELGENSLIKTTEYTFESICEPLVESIRSVLE